MSLIPLIDEKFSDPNIRRFFRDYILVMDTLETLSSGQAPREQVVDAFVTALYGTTSNPFSVIATPIVRGVVLEILREGGRDYSIRFVERMVPLVRIVENGSSPRDYFSEYKENKRRLP